VTTQAEALLNLRDRLDDPHANRWDDPTLRRFLNEACRDISRRTECLRGSDTISTFASVARYLTPVDTIRLHRVEFVDSSSHVIPLRYRDPYNMDGYWGISQDTHVSQPRFFTTWGEPPNLEIQLYPTPIEDAELRVWYYRLPVELSETGSEASSSLDLPSGWGDTAIDYAEARAWLKDRDTEGYQVAWERYLSSLSALADASVRYIDQGGGGVMPNDDYPNDISGGSGFFGGSYW